MGGTLVLGAFFHALENLTWYVVGVGLMGYVSMCVFVMCFRTCCSACGVCKFVMGCVWLCMYIIDVSDGSTYW